MAASPSPFSDASWPVQLLPRSCLCGYMAPAPTFWGKSPSFISRAWTSQASISHQMFFHIFFTTPAQPTSGLQAISQSNDDSGYKWAYVLCDRPIIRFFQQLCRMRGFSGRSLYHVIAETPLLKNSMVGVIFTFTFEYESTVYCKRKNKTI